MTAGATVPDAVIPAKAGIHSDALSHRHSGESRNPVSFARYPEYKNSGIAWVGEVPSHWHIDRLKHHARLVTDKAAGRMFPVALENIEGWSGRFVETEGVFQGEGVAFEAADILFGKLRPYLAKVYLTDRAGEAVGDFHVLRCDREVVPRYAQYQLLQREFIDTVDGSTFGSRMPRASWEFLGAMPFVLPTHDEQSAIAAFLDRETAKIDTLIAEQEKLIALLKEKSQALISHAVTKGLDPNAPMKDSGIEWLGQVPAHWTMRRLKHISPFITVGIVVNPSNYVTDEGLPFIYGGDVSEGAIAVESARRISEEDSERNAKTRLNAGDVLTVRVGAPGVTAVVGPECEGGNCASVMLVRRGDFDSDWLCYAMNSRMVRFQVEVVQYGAAQEQFNISHAVNFWVATPPRSEQSRIVKVLSSKLSDTGGLIREATRTIELLKERRSALISTAVTGKIDVRSA